MIQINERELSALIELAARAPKSEPEKLWLENIIVKLNEQQAAKKSVPTQP